MYFVILRRHLKLRYTVCGVLKKYVQAVPVIINNKPNNYRNRPSEFCSWILRSQANLKKIVKISSGCYYANILNKSLSIFRWDEILDKYYEERVTLLVCSCCQVVINVIEILFPLLILYFCSHQQAHENSFTLRSVYTCSFEVYHVQYVDLAGHFLGNCSFMYFYMADRKSRSQ